MIGIYKIISPTNKIYIGQSIDIYKRWCTYYQLNSKTKRQPKLYRSFKKYGVKTHTFEIIENCSIGLLNERERHWQEYYNSINLGLNCIYQETNYKKRKVSQQTRDKIRKANLGKKPNKETIEKLRIRMIGNSYVKGKKRDDKVKEKISKRMKEISKGKNNNMYNRFAEDNPNSKIILNTETGIYYFGSKDASIFNNIPLSTLKKALCGNRKNKTNLIYV